MKISCCIIYVQPLYSIVHSNHINSFIVLYYGGRNVVGLTLAEYHSGKRRALSIGGSEVVGAECPLGYIGYEQSHCVHIVTLQYNNISSS